MRKGRLHDEWLGGWPVSQHRHPRNLDIAVTLLARNISTASMRVGWPRRDRVFVHPPQHYTWRAVGSRPLEALNDG